MNIGQRVREAREELGMQRTVLARRVGAAENTIYRIETGKRTPSVELLEKIARELRTEPAEFLREEPTLAELPFDAVQVAREAIEEAGAETEEERYAALDAEYARRLEGWNRKDLQELYEWLHWQVLRELANAGGRGTHQELDRRAKEWEASESHQRWQQASAGRYAVAVALRALDRAEISALVGAA